jgi:Acetyltransferase (GNAT) domain
MHQEARFLERKDIDTLRWHTCLLTASAPTIYCRWEVLDRLAPGWSAVVLGNYEQVMPVTTKSKYGVRYWYMPAFMAHTGVVGGGRPEDYLDKMLQAVPRNIRYWDIDLKEEQAPAEVGGHLLERTNMFLPLKAAAEKGFHRLATRMLNKASEAGCLIKSATSVVAAIDFYRRQYAHLNLSNNDYDCLRQVFEWAGDHGMMRVYHAVVNDNLVGVYGLLCDDHWVYSVFGGTSRQGKEIGAFYLLTSTALKEFENSNTVFRFEGSDKKGIADFNAQFGASRIAYQHLRVNRLPWPLRLLKPNQYK